MPQYLTADGLKKIKKELEHLKSVRRPQIIERIQKAKELGDLAENAEYADAKDEQSFIEGKIEELENLIRKSEIIDNLKQKDEVTLGSKVVVESQGGRQEFVIVGSKEANPAAGIISNESPLGRALLQRKVGETVEVEVPKGKIIYKILEVK